MNMKWETPIVCFGHQTKLPNWNMASLRLKEMHILKDKRKSALLTKKFFLPVLP